MISLCAHPNALPFASRKGDPPGFQIELARAIAGFGNDLAVANDDCADRNLAAQACRLGLFQGQIHES